MSNGTDWSPNEGGEFEIVVQPVCSSITSDGEGLVRIEESDQGTLWGDVVNQGGISQFPVVFTAEFTTSDSFDVGFRQRTGGDVTLRADTQLIISKVG
jgi:hypothetical protein